MAADRTLINSANILAKARQPIGGMAFTQGFLAQKQKQEKETEAFNREVNALMDQFPTDIDYLKYNDTESKLIKDKIFEYQEEYADAVNALAKIPNKSSKKARILEDKRQQALKKAQDLQSTLSSHLTNKQEFKLNQQSSLYSDASQNLGRIKNNTQAYVGGFSGINDKNELVYGPGVTSGNLQKPALKYNKPLQDALDNVANDLKKPRNNKITNQQLDIAMNRILPLLTSDDIIHSLIATNQNQLFGFDDIIINETKEGFTTEDARLKVIEKLRDGFKDIADNAVRKSPTTTTRGTIPADIQEENRLKQDALKTWNNRQVTVIDFNDDKLVAYPKDNKMWEIKQYDSGGSLIEHEKSGALFPALTVTDNFDEFFSFHTGGVNK